MSPDLRPLARLLDRVLAPRQAARNAGDAAREATAGVQHRQAVAQEVDELTKGATTSPRG